MDTNKNRLTMCDAGGKAHTWRYWKEGQFWMLEAPDGYKRTLEKTWRDSVPRIQAIAENHGLTVVVS